LRNGVLIRLATNNRTEGQHDADRTLLVGGVYGALTCDQPEYHGLSRFRKKPSALVLE